MKHPSSKIAQIQSHTNRPEEVRTQNTSPSWPQPSAAAAAWPARLLPSFLRKPSPSLPGNFHLLPCWSSRRACSSFHFQNPVPPITPAVCNTGACQTAGPGGRFCWLAAALGFTCPMNSDGKSTWKLPLPPSLALPSSDLCEEHATAQGGFEVSRISAKHCMQVCYLSHNPKKNRGSGYRRVLTGKLSNVMSCLYFCSSYETRCSLRAR